ncbi:MAG: hypothetical protein OEQ39_21120 [Gammaproteobacteria bacterium]|nr:hypothetical protein [Gammaproteobacteria bacterium]
MTENEVILGLVDNTPAIGCSRLAVKCRDLTITWARYSYHGPIIEDSSVDHILDVATSKGARYCFLLGYGQVLQEQWLPGADASGSTNLVSDSFQENGIFVAGRILTDEVGWYGLDRRCVLIDLKLYSELGRPPFEGSSRETLAIPNAVPRFKGGKIVELEPGSGSAEADPKLPGWRLISESLRQGIPVISVERAVGTPVLDLAPETIQSARSFSMYLDDDIDQYVLDDSHSGLTQDQITFLDGISAQARNAKRGVFLFNIEPYTDVDSPPASPWGPVSTVYSVAAGFKANRILQTHGFDEHTRVVFFDYSPNALEIRKTMLAEWDGHDFPRFVKYLFRLFPHPENFYQLWNDRLPDQVNWSELDGFWQRELQRFGGEETFANHWNACRTLSHDFICCDILGSPETLVARMVPQENAVIWFSNAPFTVYSNWHHTLEQRKQFYDNFINQLATHAPDILLYGADYTNTSVNCISACEYWKRYRSSNHDVLCPLPLNRYQIRS